MFVSEIYDEVSEILGTTDQTKIFRKLTQAVQALMESGHWFHTNREVDICTGWDRFTLTLPKEIEVPLAVNIDGSPTYFRGRFFQYHINRGGNYDPVDWAWDDRGFVATQMDIHQPAQVIAVAETDADIGATLRLVGTDSNNRDLRTQTEGGTNVDGLIIPVNSLSDFNRGSITPPGNVVVTRDAAVSPFDTFVSSTPHQMSSGQSAILSLVSGTMPTGITASNVYYVGVVNPTTIQLYTDPLYAQQGEYPIHLTSIEGSGTIELTDQRTANLVTSVLLPSIPTVTIETGNEVTFRGTLPAPLASEVTYFVRSLDSLNLQVFNTLADAQNNTNQIYLSGYNGSFEIYIRKVIAPITQLTFSVPHYYTTGDIVQAATNGGELPKPLIVAQNYYVHVIDPLTVTIHLSYADAISGNAPIVLLSTGTGTNSLNKLIPATAQLGTTNNIVASNLGLQTPEGSGAMATAIVTGPVTNITLTNAGSGYTSPPTVTFETAGGTGYTAPTVEVLDPTGVDAAIIANITSGVVTSITVSNGGTGYSATPNLVFHDATGVGASVTVQVIGGVIQTTGYIINPVGSGASAYAQIGTVSGSPQYHTIIAFVLQSPGSGYQFPPRITLSGGSGSAGAATSVISPSFVTGYTITDQGSGYTFPPAIYLSGGGGAGASATASVQNGKVINLNVISKGTGYSTAPIVSLSPSTGAFVTFSSTGTLPSPLKAGQSYRAESPFSASGFTVMNDDFSTVPITDLGSGNFFVVISRTFGVSFTNQWTGDFSGTPSGTGIYFGTDYLLPITTPAIDNGYTEFYIKRITNSIAEVYSDSGLTSKVTVNSLGTGQGYFAIKLTVLAKSYKDFISLSSLQYLNDGIKVRFATQGTLPSPITAGTNYTIRIVGEYIQVYTTATTPVRVHFTTLPIGQLNLQIIRDFTVPKNNTISLINAIFQTGTPVFPRAAAGDILDPSLVSGTEYFVRLLNSSSIELYDTKAHANDIHHTIGRLAYTKIGNTSTSTFVLDAVEDPIFVKNIYHVEKPITEGYISLYAYDYGRSNDMTLIGQYHPTEVNPKYRRIRIGKPCSWARVIYRVKAPTITSKYDYIPVEQYRAIIAAVHAVDLEDKDFMDQSVKYWAVALGYLKNQQNSMDGHAMTPPQINDITYGDGTDPVMF